MKIGYFGLLFLCFLTSDLLTSSLVAGGKNIFCYLFPVPGPCEGNFPRYFYNVTSGYCERFVWGGCLPNPNNFETLEECLRSCVCDPCLPQPNPGYCGEHYTRYYYNVITRDCEPFSYQGCGGNGNNFFNYDVCELSCMIQRNALDSTQESTKKGKEINQV